MTSFFSPKKTALACIACVPALLASVTTYGFGPNQTGHFPENVNGMISINNSAQLYSEFERTQLVDKFEPLMNELMQDEEIVSAFNMLKGHEEALGYSLNLKSAGDILDGLDIYEVFDESNGGTAGFVVLEFKDREVATKTFDYITGSAWDEDDSATVLDAIDFDGQKIVPIRVDDIESGMNIVELNYMTLMGSNLLVSNSENAIKDGVLGNGFDAFASEVGLAEMASNVALTNTQISFYINTSSSNAFELATDQIDFPADSAGGKTFMTAGLKDGILSSKYYYLPDELEGLRSQMYSIPAADSTSILSQLGKNSLIAVGTNALQTDLFANEWDRIEADPEDPNNFMLQGIEDSTQQENGLSFRNDILPAFGPNAVVNISSGPSPIPELLVTLSTKDQAKAKVVMEKIEQNMLLAANDQVKAFNPQAPDVKILTTDYNGTEVRTINFNAQLLTVPISHAMTADGHYVFGVGPNVAQNAIDSIQSNVNTLSGSTVYQKMVSDDASEFNYFSVVNLEEIGLLLQQVLPMVGGMVGIQQADQIRYAQALSVMQAMGNITNTVRYDGKGLSGATYVQMPLK